MTSGQVLHGVWSLGLATPPPNPCFKVFCMSTAPTGRLASTLVLGTQRHSCSGEGRRPQQQTGLGVSHGATATLGGCPFCLPAGFGDELPGALVALARMER